ncbi:MAG: hypothetical protein WBX22_20315 [Silvibacterium sp.]|jgi:hypothetical protein
MATTTIPQQPDEQDEQDPLIRFIYVLGVVLTMFGAMYPGGSKWTYTGLALVAFTYVY